MARHNALNTEYRIIRITILINVRAHSKDLHRKFFLLYYLCCCSLSSLNKFKLTLVGWLSGQKQRSVKPSGPALHRFESYPNHVCNARVAELADAYGSGPYGRKALRVQVPFRAVFLLRHDETWLPK